MKIKLTMTGDAVEILTMSLSLKPEIALDIISKLADAESGDSYYGTLSSKRTRSDFPIRITRL